MKKQVLIATLATAVLASCSHDENVPTTSSVKNELGVSVNVLSGVGTRALKEGTSFAVNDAIGVFVGGIGYTSKVAAYTFSDLSPSGSLDGVPDTWVSPSAAAGKINLTNQTATVYAFYPSSAVTIPATLVGDANDQIEVTLAANESSLIGTGQTDYMYGTTREGDGSGTPPYTYPLAKASNAAADATNVYDNKVDLYMHHALAKLSFVVNKAESYAGTGLVTAIKIDSKAAAPSTPLSGSFTMKISDGTLVTTTGVTVGAISFTDATGVNANAYNLTPSTTVTAYGLAIPIAVADLRATITVDGKEMSADLPALPNSATAWVAGNNYTYTLLISGTELVVTTVSIIDWNAVDVNSGTPVDMN